MQNKSFKFSTRVMSALLVLLLIINTQTVLVSAESDNTLIDPIVGQCESEAALLGVRTQLDNAQYIDKTIDNTIKHSGSGSIKVNAKQSSYLPLIAFTPTAKLIEGELYTFSVWYNDPNHAAGNNSFEFVVRTSSGISLFSRKLSTADGWMKYECSFTASSDYADAANYFYIRANGFVGTIYFDDISFYKVDPATGLQNLVSEDVANCENDVALWAFNTYSIGTQARSIDSTERHSGTGSTKVNVNSSHLSYIGFKPIMGLIEGEAYYFSVWYKNVGPANGVKLELRGRNTANSAIMLSGTAQAITNNGWGKYECTFTADHSLAAELSYLYVTCSQIDSTVIYFDDIVLKKLDSYDLMFAPGVSACESDAALNHFKSNVVSSDAISRSIATDVAHSGVGSLKVDVDGGYKAYVGITPISNLQSGSRYYFSAWYYNPDGVAGKMYLRYAYGNRDNISNWIVGTGVADTDCAIKLEPGWNKYTYSFTADTKLSSDAFKYFYLTVDAASGTFYFDDIYLRQIPSTQTTLLSRSVNNNDLIETNSNFEFNFNNSIDGESVSNAVVQLNGIIRNDARLSLSSDNKSVSLSFLNSLQRGKSYTLSISTLSDAWGRSVSIDNITFKTLGDFSISYKAYNVINGTRVDFDGSLNEPVEVVVTATNSTKDTQEFICVLATYDSANVFVGAVISNQIMLGSGNEQKFTLSMPPTTGVGLKLFTFENLNNMRPILPAQVICSNSDDGAGDSAVYLVNDLSTGAIGYDQIVRPSGWDVDTAGGSIVAPSNRFVTLKDTSDSNAISMEREFSQRVFNNLTFETSFILPNLSSGIEFGLGNGTSCAILLKTQSSYLCYENEDGLNKVLSSISSGQNIGIKVNVDVSTQLANIYVNGSFCKAIPFKQAVEYIDRLSISTTDSGVGDVSIGFVNVYKNYIINEDFSTVASNTAPGYLTTQGSVSVTGTNDRYLVLNGSNAKLEGLFETTEDNLFGSFAFLQPGGSSTLSVGFGSVVQLTCDSGSLKLDGDAIGSYKPNVWYQIDYEIDRYNRTANIKLNGKSIAANVAINAIGNNSSLSFISNGETWIDDIKLFDKKNLYMVPAPQVLPNDDYLLGMQTYFMWHEGTHYGWDRISPYPERKPYLGWYTDGSPEVSDWEIKWMLEHGIDYEIFPWARNSTNKNLSVKRPIRSDALHDGFFNAKNSDQMKFALMWSMISTGTVGGSEDFRNNIVPYWLEYYFNDPRYLTINNKPFLSVYDYGNLISVFGSVEAVKTEFDYLRSECIKAGFDGIYLVLSTNEVDSADVFAEIASLGADAIYSYTWSYSSNTSKYQIASIDRQIQNSIATAIPYVAMGWNSQPWLGMKGEYCSLDDFEAVLQHSKSKVDALAASGDIDNKLVIVGNWNEYGEGHFIMPTGVEGFGYLDRIKKVFSPNGGASHTDSVPTQDQINSMGYLYKQDRVGEKVVPEPTDVNEYTTVIKSWEFNSFLSALEWSGGNVTGLSSWGGVLSGTSTGIDPVVVLKNDLDLDITDADYVKVRMRLTDSASCTASVMFTTEENPTWGNGKYTSFGVYHDGFYDYYVYMKSNSRWNGILKKIRIDPMESVGKFEIDSIQILKK